MVFENFFGKRQRRVYFYHLEFTFMMTEETDVPRCSVRELFVKKIIKFAREVAGECVRFLVKLQILGLNVY